jgi:2-haloacid dehalogenase
MECSTVRTRNHIADDRRELLPMTERLAVACIAVVLLMGPGAVATPPNARTSTRPTRYAAVAFDYLVLFDPDSVVPVAEREFPGKGRPFTDIWRARQFEYSWLRSVAERYVDFWTLTEDALNYAGHALQVELTPAKKRRLMDAYLRLAPWPDTVDALRRLRAAGVRVITLTNFSPAMLRAHAGHAGVGTLFDALISTDANHTYKPDPRAYQLAIDRLRLPKHRIVFAAFGGWDAAGAKSFGYPTVWVNRFGQPAEELGFRADRTVTDMNGLLDFVLQETEWAGTRH